MSQKILITGGAGFIGSHLSDRLLQSGNKVTVIDNLSCGTKKNLILSLKNPDFRFVELDITDKNKLFDFFNKYKFDMIYHLAANSDIKKGSKEPNIDFNNTFLTTFNILLAMREFKIKKLFFASTSAIYGNLNNNISEISGPLFPISNYGASKLAGEAFISSFCESNNIQAWIARFPNVIGERATHGVIFDFINKLRKNQKTLEILGNGEQNKPYLYIDDLLEAIILICEKSNDKINYFNIGPETRTKVKEIAKIVIEETGLNADIKYTGGTQGWVGDVPEFSYNISKIKELGWNSKLTSTEAVKKSVKLILNNDFGEDKK